VLTKRLVTEGNWYKARVGHLRIDIDESNHNSRRVEFVDLLQLVDR